MTNLQRTYEQRYGRPVRDILIGALRDTGRVRRAAKAIGLSHQTFYRWCRDHNIHPASEILKAKVAEAA